MIQYSRPDPMSIIQYRLVGGLNGGGSCGLNGGGCENCGWIAGLLFFIGFVLLIPSIYFELAIILSMIATVILLSSDVLSSMNCDNWPEIVLTVVLPMLFLSALIPILFFPNVAAMACAAAVLAIFWVILFSQLLKLSTVCWGKK